MLGREVERARGRESKAGVRPEQRAGPGRAVLCTHEDRMDASVLREPCDWPTGQVVLVYKERFWARLAQPGGQLLRAGPARGEWSHFVDVTDQAARPALVAFIAGRWAGPGPLSLAGRCVCIDVCVDMYAGG
jgi:hypothetical protein